MDGVLKNYVLKVYPLTKYDMFAVFMDISRNRIANNAKYGMINMQNWMFLVSYKKMREKLLENLQIDSMLHLGPNLFDELGGEVVQSTSFIITNQIPTAKSNCSYFRLVDGINCADK